MRPDLRLIADLIPTGAKVLDLGCGDGELLRILAARGGSGTGVEIEGGPFLAALRSGVDVIDLDINTQLDEFDDDSYDVVVLSGTLQNLRSPAKVLRDISRIARRCVVSMPNFVHWRNRLRLLRGRMPVSRNLPYEWYDTPNIHYTSLKDLSPLFDSLGLTIAQWIPLGEGGAPLPARRLGANWRASSVIYLLHARR